MILEETSYLFGASLKAMVITKRTAAAGTGGGGGAARQIQHEERARRQDHDRCAYGPRCCCHRPTGSSNRRGRSGPSDPQRSRTLGTATEHNGVRRGQSASRLTIVDLAGGNLGRQRDNGLVHIRRRAEHTQQPSDTTRSAGKAGGGSLSVVLRDARVHHAHFGHELGVDLVPGAGRENVGNALGARTVCGMKKSNQGMSAPTKVDTLRSPTVRLMVRVARPPPPPSLPAMTAPLP